MRLEQIILDFLKTYKNNRILLEELEKQCDGQVEYSEFAQVIITLASQGILSPVKISKPTTRNPYLYHKYNIHKPILNQNFFQDIQKVQKTYITLNLSNYYDLTEKQWKEDLPYIKQLHNYLLSNTLPDYEVLATELSYLLVGDEKWIDEGSGKAILERLKLWDKLKIQKHPDPLMMAVDMTKANNFQGTLQEHTYYHLIVENKSTYCALLEELPNSMFITLIYGQGWKIIANITQLEKQLITPHRHLATQGSQIAVKESQLANIKTTHKIFYFGDLDYEGIAIWHKLNQIRPVSLATCFYKVLLKQKESQAPKNQKRQEEALKEFLLFFPQEKELINNLLKKGNYYPQEAIAEQELREIFIIRS